MVHILCFLFARHGHLVSKIPNIPEGESLCRLAQYLICAKHLKAESLSRISGSDLLLEWQSIVKNRRIFLLISEIE